jgi:hypothetical protein
MKILKLVLKIAIGIVGLFVVLIVVLLTSESYETVTKNNGNEIVVVEIKKAFGKKLIISDFGEGSDTHPKKPKHIGCVASYRDIGNGLAVQLGF